jgi:hypothetical protein
MPNINVERKRPSLVPWLIGLILLIAAIYGAERLLSRNGSQPGTQLEMTR